MVKKVRRVGSESSTGEIVGTKVKNGKILVQVKWDTGRTSGWLFDYEVEDVPNS